MKSLEEAHATCGDDLAESNYTTQQLQIKLDTRDTELAALKASESALIATQAAGQEQIASQEAEIQQLKIKLGTRDTELAALKAAHDGLVADHAAGQQRIAKQVDEMRLLAGRLESCGREREMLELRQQEIELANQRLTEETEEVYQKSPIESVKEPYRIRERAL